MTAALALDPRQDRIVRKAMLACLVGLGGFIVWAGLVPLSEGVAARGSIVVQTNRQNIQHLEGGIVRAIHVREGAVVKKGAPLLTLDDTTALASRDLIAKEFAAHAASEARLTALQLDRPRPDFSAIAQLALSDEDRKDIVNREQALFDQQKKAREADIAVLSARRKSAAETAVARAGEIRIVERALGAARRELLIRREMFSEKLVRLDQLTATERELARLEGDIARLSSERQEALALELDLDAQISQTGAKHLEEVAQSLLQAKAERLSSEERLRAAQDVLDRSLLRAPDNGEVLNLRFSTLGGVIRPGESVMEIVPPNGEMTSTVQIRPVDRSAVFKGQKVRLQIAAYRSWLAPRLEGEVTGVSADLKTDPDGGNPHYEARISVSVAEVKKLRSLDVTPGMPVDVFIHSGRRRTLIDYLFEPIGESLFRGLRSA